MVLKMYQLLEVLKSWLQKQPVPSQLQKLVWLEVQTKLPLGGLQVLHVESQPQVTGVRHTHQEGKERVNGRFQLGLKELLARMQIHGRRCRTGRCLALVMAGQAGRARFHTTWMLRRPILLMLPLLLPLDLLQVELQLVLQLLCMQQLEPSQQLPLLGQRQL